MNFDQHFNHYILGLIAIANNMAAIPVFLENCKNLNKIQRLRASLYATLSSYIIMIVAMFCGLSILHFFSISISAFQITGGIILYSTGLNMLNSPIGTNNSNNEVILPKSKVISNLVVPVSFPLTIGAGSISTITLFSDIANTSNSSLALFAAIPVMSFIIFILFYFSWDLISLLGDVGKTVFIKVMGLFTMALGIQFIIIGATAIYKNLGS